jgi:dihydroorotate dehydrogenase (NAD+) catalytic subunit
VLLNASGCLDALAAPDVASQLDVFVTKTVTPLPREGNPPVRIAETEVGMLNSIGLANPGIDRFLESHLPRLADLGVPIWVSVGGFSPEDYALCCSLLDERDEIETIELNLSCPNVAAPEGDAIDIVSAARAATGKPLYAKLSPALPDVPAVARAAVGAGANGLSLINTIRGLALDGRTLEPTLSKAAGGLSGPALRPVALAAVFACHQAVDVPIVGMGGVSQGRHVLELVAAGATAVAVGTALFSDPVAPTRIRVELEAELHRIGVDNLDVLRGIAHEKGGLARIAHVENLCTTSAENMAISTEVSA